MRSLIFFEYSDANFFSASAMADKTKGDGEKIDMNLVS